MPDVKAIVVSDIHLGNPYSNWRLLEDYLMNNSCEFLFLNGDIIDEHYLTQNNKILDEEENHFLYWMMNLKNTEVKYIIGNHEDFDHSIPVNGEIWNKYEIKVYHEYLYSPNIKWTRYYISHGHDTIFSNFVTGSPIILKAIDWTIRTLAKVQKIHSGLVFRKGKFDVQEGVEFELLSNDSRKFFKTGLKFISNYKRKAKKYKLLYNAGIICGHIHLPEIKRFKSKYKKTNFPYMNSGDWLENNSLLTQDHFGKWKIVKL
jgi:UDP-2,3-diacylglucosamine pyrophosphatase LpxH